MSRFAEPLARLIEELRKLPGVGAKSAQRLAFHILRASDADADALSAAIRELKAQLHLCSVCNNITDIDPCIYCASPTRNQRLICGVEEPTSIQAIEKSRNFNGVYHVLHGTLSPLNGIGPEQLRIANLLTRVQAPAQEEDEAALEIILATSPTSEGEATASHIAEQLRHARAGIHVSRIATGIPAGAELEYSDEVTISRALEGRRTL